MLGDVMPGHSPFLSQGFYFEEFTNMCCLNIEKRQDKRRGAKEKRMDKPRTPKNTAAIESI